MVNLPAAASGQTIQLRWRCGSDNSNSGAGWYVDTVSITSSGYVCCASSPNVAVSISIRLSVGTGASITFPSQTGVNYALEYKNSLDDPTWTVLSPAVAGTGGLLVLQDTNAPVASRYYRVSGE